MKTSDIIGPGKAWPTQTAAARALGITQGAIAKWAGEVPALRQFQIREVLAKKRKGRK